MKRSGFRPRNIFFLEDAMDKTSDFVDWEVSIPTPRKRTSFRPKKTSTPTLSLDIDNLPPVFHGIDVSPLQMPLGARKPMKRGKPSVMSKTLRDELSKDKEYTLCSLHNYQNTFGSCAGRVTREHALIYAGRKIQEKWAIIPCCAQHHGVDFYQDSRGEAPKEVRVWVALNRASDTELLSVSKVQNYIRIRAVLNDKYGVWTSPVDIKGKTTV